MSPSNVLRTLWNIAEGLKDLVQVLWDFLTTKVTFGGDKILGILNLPEISFTPIYIFGGGMIVTLLTLVFIKNFIPGA
jgi:hypothetical protein